MQHDCGHDTDDERDVLAVDIFTRVTARLVMKRELEGGPEAESDYVSAAAASFYAADAFMAEWRERHPERFEQAQPEGLRQ